MTGRQEVRKQILKNGANRPAGCKVAFNIASGKGTKVSVVKSGMLVI